MTRNEQIEKEARRVSYNGDEFSSFIIGAEWADKTIIDKACKWFESIDTDKYMDNNIFQMSDLIRDFKKAMEE